MRGQGKPHTNQQIPELGNAFGKCFESDVELSDQTGSSKTAFDPEAANSRLLGDCVAALSAAITYLS
jgi:hypothetical protein